MSCRPTDRDQTTVGDSGPAVRAVTVTRNCIKPGWHGLRSEEVRPWSYGIESLGYGRYVPTGQMGAEAELHVRRAFPHGHVAW